MISIVIKSLLSDWPIENLRWRPFSKLATDKKFLLYKAGPKLAEFIYLSVKINVLNNAEVSSEYSVIPLCNYNACVGL